MERGKAGSDSYVNIPDLKDLPILQTTKIFITTTFYEQCYEFNKHRGTGLFRRNDRPMHLQSGRGLCYFRFLSRNGISAFERER